MINSGERLCVAERTIDGENLEISNNEIFAS